MRTDVRGHEYHLTPGVLDAAAARYLTNGQCHTLAAALSEATGHPIGLIRTRCSFCDACSSWMESDEPLAPCDEPHGDHLILALPDGRFLDALGTHPDEEAIAERFCRDPDDADWMDAVCAEDTFDSIEIIEAEDVAAWLEDPAQVRGYPAPDLDLVRTYVDAVLDQLA